MRTVDPNTAGHPPPRDRSNTIGNVSFVMTLLSSKVTRTQCLPLRSKLSTLAACDLSVPSPESLMTWRYTSSFLTHHQLCTFQTVVFLLTCPINAIVNPANAPPNNTSTAATLKYIHRLGSSGSFPSASSAAERDALAKSGRACTRGIRPIERKRIFASPKTIGLRVR